MKDPIRVTTLTRIWRAMRRRLSRVEWAVWLLGLPRKDGEPTERGLILVQIDGLSRTQLERALEQGRMPFVGSLLEKEHYHNHVFYSGLPSSTPAVQAELYYGERTVVPGFGFRDPRSGQLVRMFANEIAGDVEQRLQTRAEGLLEGGSSYCNIYGGGAAEVHFCATSFGWDELLRTINPLKWLLVLLLNCLMFFRVLGLMIIEFFLAIFDCIRGVFSGRRFWQELIMIPARVMVVVLLRELVTIGASYDTARGLPVIHINLLGYDEQAHRRGPSSRFAYWTLRGIDRAIKRLWRAAHRGAGREYDMWIFSDHGQEATRPYELEHEKLVQQAVAEIVEEYVSDVPVHESSAKRERLPTRANWLGIGWLVRMLFGEQDMDMQSRSSQVQTATSGPLGFVYFLDRELKSHVGDIARRLVHEADVPMVVLPATATWPVRVFVRENDYVLPRDAIQVFGAEHPFLEDVSEDLIALAALPESGDMVLVRWTNQMQSTSFVLQNGAHAGPGIE
ncbi:MAG: alkaline phosphatase family protein, partial [Pirellulaceae bacterium]